MGTGASIKENIRFDQLEELQNIYGEWVAILINATNLKFAQ